MRNFTDFIQDHLTAVITTVVAVLAAAAVAIPMMAWSNSVGVTETTARVTAVGSAYTETYQCGSTGGKVSVPIYCTRTVYPTSFSVAGTDESFDSKVYSAPTVGVDYRAYKVVDGNSYFYTLSSPQDFGYYILVAVLALVAALVAGIIAYLITDHFVY